MSYTARTLARLALTLLAAPLVHAAASLLELAERVDPIWRGPPPPSHPNCRCVLIGEDGEARPLGGTPDQVRW